MKGKLVVFSQTDGKLASLRVSEVAFDESATATTQAKQAPAEAAPVPDVSKKKSVLVLTDHDVAHVNETGGTSPAEKAGEKPADVPSTDNSVKVGVWEKTRSADGLGTEITGNVVNGSKNTATDIQLTIKGYGADGKLLVTTDGVLAKTVIPPGESTTFHATLPGVGTLENALFEVRSRGLVTAPPAPPPAEPKT